MLLASLLSLNDLESCSRGRHHDPIPNGFSRTEYAAETALWAWPSSIEPGDDQIAVPRGNEYSLYTELVHDQRGSDDEVDVKIVRVLETPASSLRPPCPPDRQPGSWISSRNRVLSMAGEGVEHRRDRPLRHHRPDPDDRRARIWRPSSAPRRGGDHDPGYGHTTPTAGVDRRVRRRGGSTDWAGAALLARTSSSETILSPVEIEALGALRSRERRTRDGRSNQPHRQPLLPLKIDTSLVPPASLSAVETPMRCAWIPASQTSSIPSRRWRWEREHDQPPERVPLSGSESGRTSSIRASWRQQSPIPTPILHDLRSGGGRTWDALLERRPGGDPRRRDRPGREGRKGR